MNGMIIFDFIGIAVLAVWGLILCIIEGRRDD